ncbi:hypothetical protein SMD44_p10039 (plasmid) [Streptomyces alboflavus]|uniref:Uncharacterized protein n=1 Tax=Streptomyces alboflavus TaxID=67267 RepID=A0A291W3E2_9ACTN|nr:hypothetical protein [Streptomyces alboflavus]ATM24538.1 hypothetical protein SMD44_p10039 [Streptomyces alboflavus]
MPLARYALQYASQLAELLGPDWRAGGCGSATFAVLSGPGIELGVSTASPLRAGSEVRVETRLRSDLAWPRRTDYHGKVQGTAGDPAAVAEAIRREVLPAWTALVTELEARTRLQRSSLRQFASLAAATVGEGATIHYGSRPGVADLRWDGGWAVLWADDKGCISSPHVQTRHVRGAEALLAMLTAISPSAVS